MGKKKVVDIDSNTWMITFIKTVDGNHVVYYRLTNLKTYRTLEVAAHKLVDEIINNGMHICNIRSQNNKIIVNTEDGYDGCYEIITVDEFDSDVPNIYEWALLNEDLGVQVMNMYNQDLNLVAPSNISIDNPNKLAWTCKKGHTTYMDFATLASFKCKCPICKADEDNEVLSLKTWANITENKELLEQYRSCELNSEASSKIAFNSKKKVFWRKEGKDIEMSLYDVTVKGDRPFTSGTINLSRIGKRDEGHSR